MKEKVTAKVGLRNTSEARYSTRRAGRRSSRLFAFFILQTHSTRQAFTNVAKMLVENWKVESDNVKVTADCIEARYQYANTDIARDEDTGAWTVRPTNEEFKLSTSTIVPKLG